MQSVKKIEYSRGHISEFDWKQHGLHGWELVTVDKEQTAYFKREIIEDEVKRKPLKPVPPSKIPGTPSF